MRHSLAPKSWSGIKLVLREWSDVLCQWNGVRHYAASREVAGSSPNEVNFLNLPNPSGLTDPGFDSASNRIEYHESLKIKKPRGKVRLARRADNVAAIY
jgi:hypothetical protein